MVDRCVHAVHFDLLDLYIASWTGLLAAPGRL